MTMLTAGALTDPRLPATASNVCTTDARLCGVDRVLPPNKNPGYADRVMADRRISKRLKGKVMSTCGTPACLYGTETLALTELQQQRLQVCENNWVRKIA